MKKILSITLLLLLTSVSAHAGKAKPGSGPLSFNDKELKDFFERSKANMFNQNSMNLKSVAMKPVFEGQTTVYLYADDEKEIVDGITFLKGYGIDKIVIVGATESESQLNFIKENNISKKIVYDYCLKKKNEI